MARETYFAIKLKGLEDAQDFVRAQLAKLKEDRRRVLLKIARDFYRIEREWFESEGGGRWRPLSKRYSARKAKAFPGKRLLRRTDRMYREFTGKTGHAKVARNVLDVNILGVPYWQAHEEGNQHLPQREVISPWIAGRIDTWNDMVTEDIQVRVRTGKR